ncbi:MAG TPA: TolC family protein [Desulfobulbus sp.]|nr:TolC family protein [Desulfobulbus sp.]
MNLPGRLPAILALAACLALVGGCVPMATVPAAALPSSPAASYLAPASLPGSVPTPVQGPAFQEGVPLTLARCVAIAFAQNPETRESWQRAKAAAAGVGQARAAYLPTLDFAAGTSRANPASPDSPQDTGVQDRVNATFETSYLLFDGGTRAAGLHGAEAGLLAASLQHDTTLQDLALRVAEAYYHLLAAREFERVAEETVRQTQYHLDVARARHENGLAARSDVLKATTEKASADLGLVRARSATRIARGSLANVMGLQPSVSFEIAEMPPTPVSRKWADVDHLMAQAAASRPDLAAALARVRGARARVAAADAAYWPKLTVNSDYGWSDRSLFPGRDEWFLGLELHWPLFTGFSREYSLHKARAELAGAGAGYEKLLRGVELQVWTAYSQLTEAVEAVEAARALVASAEESARVTEGEYKNGTASIIDVTDAQTARTVANVRLVQARLDWRTAMARLERAVGEIVAAPQKDTKVTGENRP